MDCYPSYFAVQKAGMESTDPSPRHHRREWQQINDALKQWPLPTPTAPPKLGCAKGTGEFDDYAMVKSWI